MNAAFIPEQRVPHGNLTDSTLNPQAEPKASSAPGGGRIRAI